MKDKVKYGHELLDIEIPEGTDLSILLPKQHPTGVRSEEEIVEDALDQKRMAEVNVECYPKEQPNEVSAPFWRNMTTPRCCICRRPPLRCRW